VGILFFTVLAIIIGIVVISYFAYFIQKKDEMQEAAIINAVDESKEEEKLVEQPLPVVIENPAVDPIVEVKTPLEGLLNQAQVNELKKKRKPAVKKTVKKTSKTRSKKIK